MTKEELSMVGFEIVAFDLPYRIPKGKLGRRG